MGRCASRLARGLLGFEADPARDLSQEVLLSVESSLRLGFTVCPAVVLVLLINWRAFGTASFVAALAAAFGPIPAPALGGEVLAFATGTPPLPDWAGLLVRFDGVGGRDDIVLVNATEFTSANLLIRLSGFALNSWIH